MCGSQMGELRIRSWELKGLKNILISTQALAIRENIGYPEYLTNKTALYSLFKGVSLTYSASSFSVIQHSLSIPFFLFRQAESFLLVLNKQSSLQPWSPILLTAYGMSFFFIVLKPALVKINNNVVDLFCCCLFF